MSIPVATSEQLTLGLKEEATRLGFGLVGVCPAVSPVFLAHFDEWLSAGYAGEMRYLADRRSAYEHPRTYSTACAVC